MKSNLTFIEEKATVKKNEILKYFIYLINNIL